MDLNTREIYRENSIQIFNNLKVSVGMTDLEFLEMKQKLNKISVNPIRKNVFLLLGNKFFLIQKFEFAFQCYQNVPFEMFNFFELMSYLDTTVFIGQVKEREQLISFSMEKIVKEKRINLLSDYIKKLKSLRVPQRTINNILEQFILITGDSSLLKDTRIGLSDKNKVESIIEKIDFWKKDEAVLNLMLFIKKEQFENLSPSTKDKVKFHCLNKFHREIIKEIASFDWVAYIDFLLATGRAIGYEEVNRIVFDFNVPIEPVKILDLKSLNLENEKLDQVEKVMGEIGLGADFEEEALPEEVSEAAKFSEVVRKIEFENQNHDTGFIKSLSKIEPTQVLEYMKYLKPDETNNFLGELEKEIQVFQADDEPEYIREQVNKAYVFIKAAIYAKEYARAFKMMDFVISEYPLSKRELNSFIRLKRELKIKWKEV